MKKFSVLFVILLCVAWLSSAIFTLIPDSSASKACYLGYKAHCSFTPFGTMISILAAGFTSFIAKRLLWR